MPALCGENYGRRGCLAAQKPVCILKDAVLQLLPLTV